MVLCMLASSVTSGFAGAWTLPKGRTWGKVTYFQQRADEWYISSAELQGRIHEAGSRRPYRFGGKYDSKAVFIEGFIGVTDRFDLGVQIPYFDQEFVDDTRLRPQSDAGFSDVRVLAKWRTFQRLAVLTVKAGVKFPTGDFRNEDGLIPVGEGQSDYDFIVQVGRSFWPIPIYGNVDVGYRVRMKNDEIDRDPGDEWLFNGEIGYSATPRLLVAFKFEALRGKKGTDFGFIRSSSSIKRVTYLSPTVAYKIHGNTTIEFTIRSTINGQNFPAGQQITLGVSKELDLPNALRTVGLRN